MISFVNGNKSGKNVNSYFQPGCESSDLLCGNYIKDTVCETFLEMRVALVDATLILCYRFLKIWIDNPSCILGLGCWGGERLRPMSRMAGGAVISSGCSSEVHRCPARPRQGAQPLSPKQKKKRKKLVMWMKLLWMMQPLWRRDE